MTEDIDFRIQEELDEVEDVEELIEEAEEIYQRSKHRMGPYQRITLRERLHKIHEKLSENRSKLEAMLDE